VTDLNRTNKYKADNGKIILLTNEEKSMIESVNAPVPKPTIKSILKEIMPQLVLVFILGIVIVYLKLTS